MNCNRIILTSDEIPQKWYNILPDLPERIPPPLNPETKEVISLEGLMKIFPKESIRQEVSEQNFIDIPSDVLDAYVNILNRPTPLVRARRLEKYLKTPAKIYYKREDVTPTGSHKPNTAIAQAFYASKEGLERLTTETGAGQWGSALALSTNIFGLKATVYMVKVSFEQKQYRKVLMKLWDAEVFPSPSNRTKVGREILKKDPNNPGSLGIAISEALEDAISSEDTKYSLGSVLNHVLLHQTIIGLETKRQLESIDNNPDVLIGAVGGGSNFGGLILPFVRDVLKKKRDIEIIAVEPEACPSITKGKYEYDYGDTAELTPLLKMYTLGHKFIPAPIHAGGLRYHGSAPIISLLVKHGIIKSKTYRQEDVFTAAKLFAKVEGLVPAPETAHAIKATIDRAIEDRKLNREETIVFSYSGHGLLDLSSYAKVLPSVS
ncbi:MAG: TrpB-like pyridoxal phosphate-dependent enzyme [Candidatus Odinarchaeota archaeon]|nr:TrpB-like pyridoxal phosphate-dependent enzyme [Candidatus Odinarchaeota archaeon]